MKRLALSITALVYLTNTSARSLQTPAVSSPTPTALPRVFITDSESWEVSGSAGGNKGGFAAESHGGARPQTAEIIKTFGQRCSEVIVNNRQELADYIVLLDHEGGKGYLRHRNKVAVFAHLSGDVVVSHSTLSLGGSVEDACKGIAQNWAAHSTEMLSAKMPTAPATPAVVTTAVAQQNPPSAQAAVSIDSAPAAADIEIDGAFVGNTPSTISLAPGSHDIVVKKKGFAEWSKKLNVSGGIVHLNAELEATPAQ